MPGASIKRPTASSEKGWQGIVSSDYVSNKSADEIKQHYQTELLTKNWKFCRLERALYRNHDYGGQLVYYRKGPYLAALQLAGKQETEFGWTYSFAMSWGISDDVVCS